MGIFGNLENLNLGMGLKATQAQYISAENVGFDGWSPLSEQDKAKKTTISVFTTLLLLFILYKVGSR